MDRQWKSGAAGAPPALDNASAGYATAGNAGTGVPPSKPGPHWFHMITEEILSVVTAAAIAFDKTDVSQLLKALKTFGLLGGLSGGGVGQFKFPGTQNPSADVNTLDDYEEGTWTPVLGGVGGTSGQAYSGQVGFYIKIGRLFIGTFQITQSTRGTITGQLQVQGIPFALSYGLLHVGYYVLASSIVWITGILSGTTAMSIYLNTAASSSIAAGAQADLPASNGQLYGTIVGITTG